MEGSIDAALESGPSSKLTGFDFSPENDIREKKFYDRDRRHQRYLDSITSQSIDRFFDDHIDLIVREEFVLRDNPRKAEYEDIVLHPERKYDKIVGTETDLLLVSLDKEVIAAYEVKPNIRQVEAGRETLREFKDYFLEERSRTSAEIGLTGKVITGAHLNDDYTGSDELNNYDDGIYATPETVSRVQDSEVGELLGRILETEITQDNIHDVRGLNNGI